MNTLALATPDRHTRLTRPLRHVTSELLARERRLTLFAALLLALAVPMAVAAGLDERLLRGANVWIKPIKFALSIALLALTTAWFVGHLRPERRRSRAMGRIVWLLIVAGSFELGYIGLQAALGQGSHYNVGDPLHAIMYPLMGLGALGLTATQPLLAWQLRTHADPSRPSAYRLAVRLGLGLTFVFGAGVGMLLSGLQPPDAGAASLPVFGWSLQGGDLRPAHFIGIHAGQLLPLAGWWFAARAGTAPATRRVWWVTTAYSALFAAAVAFGLVGRF
ncbi:MAG: hypothetical protein HZC37_18700 [Burkholderiales bacterium]|nr:hypothetical protein [Burkholderiales bacterium]